MPPFDTTSAANRRQHELVMSWTPTDRLRRYFEMSEAAWETVRIGIRRRHPEYDERQVELARRRLSWGDELFGRVHPDAVSLEP